MEQVQVGDTKIQNEHLNMLHLAVKNQHNEIVQAILDKIPGIDIVQDGKIPRSSDLANESEQEDIASITSDN